MSDTTTAGAESAVRPFRIEVPQGEIDELRRRIDAARWPTRELVTDRSQGVQLAPHWMECPALIAGPSASSVKPHKPER